MSTVQVVETIRQFLNESMRWVLQEVEAQQRQGNPGIDACLWCWTRAIKTALCCACGSAYGGCSPIHVCATKNALGKPAQNTICRHSLQSHVYAMPAAPYVWNANKTEWLHDVTCLKYEEPPQEPWPRGQNTLLAAEVEWKGRNDILRDFCKLLVARAEIRVLVYHQVEVSIDELADYIHRCGDTQPGDRYLLAAFGEAKGNVKRNIRPTPRIIYYQIDAEGGHKLSPIPGDWYPGHGPPQP